MLLHNSAASFFFAFSFISLLATSSAGAGETSIQVKEAVTHFVKEHINQRTNLANQRIEFSIGYIDSRLALQPCPTSPQVAFKGNKSIGRLTTKVTCPEGTGWSLYVPVTIDVYQLVTVADGPIPRGTALQTFHLRLVEKNVSQLYRGYYAQTKPLLGFITTRALRNEEVITPHILTAPKVVHRNEEVTITAKAGGLRVRAVGVALSDGVLGEKISVRNKTTKKVIEARVKGPGKVEIQI